MKTTILTISLCFITFYGFTQVNYKIGLHLGTSIVGISESNAQKFDLLETRSGQLAFGVDLIRDASKYQSGFGYRNFNTRFNPNPLTLPARLTQFNNNQFHYFIDRKISKHFMLGSGLFCTFLTQNLEKLNNKKIEQVAQGQAYPSGDYLRNYVFMKEKIPVGLLLSLKTSLFKDKLAFSISRNQALMSFHKNGLFMGYFDDRNYMAFSSWQVSSAFKFKVR